MPQPVPTIVGLPAVSFPGFLSWCEGSVRSVTFVPGGGLNANCAASGRPKSTEVNATSNAGSDEPLARTWTRSGTCFWLSMATRTEATSEAGSFGVSTSS